MSNSKWEEQIRLVCPHKKYMVKWSWGEFYESYCTVCSKIRWTLERYNPKIDEREIIELEPAVARLMRVQAYEKYKADREERFGKEEIKPKRGRPRKT